MGGYGGYGGYGGQQQGRVITPEQQAMMDQRAAARTAGQEAIMGVRQVMQTQGPQAALDQLQTLEGQLPAPLYASRVQMLQQMVADGQGIPGAGGDGGGGDGGGDPAPDAARERTLERLQALNLSPEMMQRIMANMGWA